MRNYFYLTIQPHTIIEILGIYPHIPKDIVISILNIASIHNNLLLSDFFM